MTMTIGKRVVLGFAAVIAVGLIVSAVTVVKLNAIHHSSVEVVDVAMPSAVAVNQMESNFRAVNEQTLEHVLAETPAEHDEAEAGIKRFSGENDKLIKRYEQLIDGEKERETFATMTGHLADVRALRAKVLELSRAGKAKEAVAFALIGWATLHGIPASVPSCTGARGARVLGRVTPGPASRVLPTVGHPAPTSLVVRDLAAS